MEISMSELDGAVERLEVQKTRLRMGAYALTATGRELQVKDACAVLDALQEAQEKRGRLIGLLRDMKWQGDDVEQSMVRQSAQIAALLRSIYRVTEIGREP